MIDSETVQKIERYTAKLKLSGISLKVAYNAGSKIPIIVSVSSDSDPSMTEIRLSSINNGRVELFDTNILSYKIDFNEIDFDAQTHNDFVGNKIIYTILDTLLEDPLKIKSLTNQKFNEIESVVKSITADPKSYIDNMDKYKRNIEILKMLFEIKIDRMLLTNGRQRKFTYDEELIPLSRLYEGLGRVTWTADNGLIYDKDARLLIDIANYMTHLVGNGSSIFSGKFIDPLKEVDEMGFENDPLRFNSRYSNLPEGYLTFPELTDKEKKIINIIHVKAMSLDEALPFFG